MAIIIMGIFLDTILTMLLYHGKGLTCTNQATAHLVAYEDEFKKVLTGILDPALIDPRYIYTAILEFQTNTGETIKFHDGPYKTQKKYKPGVEYAIQYDPDKPTDLFFVRNKLTWPRIALRLAIILLLIDWIMPEPVTIGLINQYLPAMLR